MPENPAMQNKKDSLKQMTWGEHFAELRRRLILTLLPFFLLFGIAFYSAPTLYEILVYPLKQAHGQRLIYTGLTEAFISYVKLALWAAFFINCPLFLYQAWRFIAPGLYRNEKNHYLPYFILTPLLFYTGAALAYFYIFPLAFKFFLSFEQQAPILIGLPIQLEARMSEYLSLTMTLLIAFGLAFELPILIMLLNRAGLVDVTSLKKGRKYAILMIFIAAAILTPPDVVSQIGLAIPLILLYEISILWLQIKEEKIKKNV